MPSAGVIVGAMVVGLLAIGAHKAVHGVKKAAHEIGCVVKTGHKCLPKLPSPDPPK